MELPAIFQCVVGLDVHQAKVSACALIEQPDGTLTIEHREFGAFKRDRRALAEWARTRRRLPLWSHRYQPRRLRTRERQSVTVAVYPGSFDPITKGHTAILKSGLVAFEKIIVAGRAQSTRHPPPQLDRLVDREVQ